MRICRIGVTAGLALSLASVAQAQRLAITPERIPPAVTGSNYYEELHAAGGTAPYTWSARGEVPPGITFDAPSATFAGIPSRAGNYRLSVTVTDSARHSASRTYELHVAVGNTITMTWTRAPQITGGGIFGEVEVGNPGADTFDITFIVLAVNGIGRATALGYQHFSLPPGRQRIPFGATLPGGTYVVHADAVGENARSGIIRRARLQTQSMAVP